MRRRFEPRSSWNGIPFRGGCCPKCGGNLYFEVDAPEGFLLRKCLQCGLIESYFWLERSTRVLIPLPVEDAGEAEGEREPGPDPAVTALVARIDHGSPGS
ncbi:MAG TPA: hypothetical protein VF221_04875 [Chloroflexota bacterium]